MENITACSPLLKEYTLVGIDRDWLSLSDSMHLMYTLKFFIIWVASYENRNSLLQAFSCEGHANLQSLYFVYLCIRLWVLTGWSTELLTWLLLQWLSGVSFLCALCKLFWFVVKEPRLFHCNKFKHLGPAKWPIGLTSWIVMLFCKEEVKLPFEESHVIFTCFQAVLHLGIKCGQPKSFLHGLVTSSCATLLRSGSLLYITFTVFLGRNFLPIYSSSETYVKPANIALLDSWPLVVVARKIKLSFWTNFSLY